MAMLQADEDSSCELNKYPIIPNRGTCIPIKATTIIFKEKLFLIPGMRERNVYAFKI